MSETIKPATVNGYLAATDEQVDKWERFHQSGGDLMDRRTMHLIARIRQDGAELILEREANGMHEETIADLREEVERLRTLLREGSEFQCECGDAEGHNDRCWFCRAKDEFRLEDDAEECEFTAATQGGHP